MSVFRWKKTWVAYWQAQYGKWKSHILGKIDDSTIVTCVQRLHTGGSVAQWPPSSSYKFTPKKALDGRGCRKSIIISRLLTVTPWYQAFTGIVPSAFTIVAEHSWVCWESDPVNHIVGRRVCWSLQVRRHFWEPFLTYTRRKGAPFRAIVTLTFAWHLSHLLTYGKLNAGILAPLLLVACRLSVLGHAPLGDLPHRDTANN